MKPMKVFEWPTIHGYDDIADLSAIRGADGAIYSAWVPSWQERLAVLFGQPVVVGVLSQQQPPITLVVGRQSIPQASATEKQGTEESRRERREGMSEESEPCDHLSTYCLCAVENIIRRRAVDGTPGELREALAKLCHEQWSGWMDYLWDKCSKTRDGALVIPRDYAERWWRQKSTAYANLPENEKDSDRKEADRFLAVATVWKDYRAAQEKKDG